MVKKNAGGNFLKKAESCPPELIGGHVSKWGVAKLHMKEKLVCAAGKISRGPSFVSEEPPRKYTDGKPVVLVGPIIGLVTKSTARILLEVDRHARVEISLQKLELPHNNLQEDSFFSESFMSSVSQRLWRGTSSPAWLRSSTLAETAFVNTESAENSAHSLKDNSIHSCDDTGSSASVSPKLSWRKSSKLSKETAFVNTESAENSAHSHKDNSIHSCDDTGSSASVSLKLPWRKSSKLSMQRSSPESMRKALLRKSSMVRVQGTSFEKESPAENKLSRDVSNTSDYSRGAEKGTAYPRRRRSGGFAKIWSPRHSSLSKQDMHYLAQGGGGEGITLSVVKEMVARHPCIFEFTTLEPESRYKVEVKGCHDAEHSSFKTFSVEALKKFCMASISCNSIFITNKTITSIDDLWSHLYNKSIHLNQIDLLIHLGDQIYGDGDPNLDAGAGKNRDKWSNRFKIALDMLKGLPRSEWMSKQEEICEKYREVYRDTWKYPSTAKCLAHCPNLMIYDDHEIRDNWGDNRLDRRKDSVEFFVAQCAWRVALEYQRQLHEDVDFSNLEAIKKDHHFHVIGKIGLMFLDIRGSRTFHRVENDKTPYLGSRQWDDIEQALADGGLFDRVKVLVVCSPAPLVFLVPAVTRAAHNIVDRLEDFKGHWSVYKPEQKKMIDCLRQWKEGPGREVIFLGGDVHCGGHSCILKNNETLFYQLTTSPIANMPLSKTVYYAMRFAEQLEHIQEELRFRHFNWTRARNYGLVRVNFHGGEDDSELPEIITQLVRGKFLRPVRMGKRVSNLEEYTCTVCSSMTPVEWCKTRMFNVAFRTCEKTLLSGNSRRHDTLEKDDKDSCKNVD